MAAEVKKYVTPPFRVSFPHVFEASSHKDGGEPKFGTAAIWTPAKFTANDKKRWKAIINALKAASREAHSMDWSDLSSDRRGIHNGKKKADMPGYGKDTRYASLTSKQKPQVIDLDKCEISVEAGNTEKIYPGCYCRATVTVYTYTKKGKGVSLGLQNLQFVKDGERLDSRTDAAEDFEDDLDDEWLDADEEDADLDDDDDDLDL